MIAWETVSMITCTPTRSNLSGVVSSSVPYLPGLVAAASLRSVLHRLHSLSLVFRQKVQGHTALGHGHTGRKHHRFFITGQPTSRNISSDMDSTRLGQGRWMDQRTDHGMDYYRIFIFTGIAWTLEDTTTLGFRHSRHIRHTHAYLHDLFRLFCCF